MKNIKLSIEVMERLIVSTDLFGKVNLQLADMENPYLLTYILETIDTLKSNEIEDIHSTVDEAGDDFITENNASPYVRYRNALKNSHRRLINKEIIRMHDITYMNNEIRGKKIGIRKTPVNIKDSKGQVIHKGIDANKIQDELSNLITRINEDWDMNNIVKALLIHHDFERIHPFSDGNGRTGRMLFAIILSKFEILNVPASIFSYSVSKNKLRYYKALSLADNGDFNGYLEIMLTILNDSLKVSIEFAKEFKKQMKRVLDIEEIKASKRFTLVTKWVFSGVKVSTGYITKKTKLNIKTVTKYLEMLVTLGILEVTHIGRNKPFKNLVIEKIISKYV